MNHGSGGFVQSTGYEIDGENVSQLMKPSGIAGVSVVKPWRAPDNYIKYFLGSFYDHHLVVCSFK